METGKDGAKRTEARNARPWEAWMSGGPNDSVTAGCCGSETGEMPFGCPCGSVMKEHRFAAITVFAVAALTFLVGVAGTILGIIAFFRTF